MATIFVYGTLRDRSILEAVLGRPYDQPMDVAARLRGYRKYQGPIYPWLIELDGASVQGLLLRGLDAEDMKRLDQYEGLSRGLYTRQAVRLHGEDVYVYVAGKHLRQVTLNEIRREKA